MEEPKFIAFTVNTGGYDNLPIPYVTGKGWYKVLFTDSTALQKRGWDKIIILPKTDRPDLQAKQIKWGIHKHFSQATHYLYYDANMVVKNNLPPTPFKIRHPKRNTVLQEAHACNVQEHRWTVASITTQFNQYQKEDFPDTQGLYLNGFWCRENSEIENKLADLVYEQITTFTTRDQIALPYALWKLDYTYPKEIIKHPSFFAQNILMSRHRELKPKLISLATQKVTESLPELVKNPTVYYFTPASSDKNFGKACNNHCENVPNDDDWICLRDADTMFLTPNYATLIENIVAKHHDKYDLIGCYTNRIGLEYQQYNGHLSQDTNILNHIKIAKEQEEKYGSDVAPLNKNIAGFFMLFKKSAWKEHKFEEGLLVTKKDYNGKVTTGYIDYWFSNYFARKKRVGIAKGLYVFHLYRLFHDNHKVQTHLR
jgi:hypothetical protein